jgi:hypothetical protein
VAQGDQIGGLLGCLDACDASNSKDIPLFMTSRLNQFIGGSMHLNTTTSNGYSVGGGLIANIDHMGLATGIKVCKFVHRIGFTI